ncbi:MaoC family dehydratase [Skermania sp. ID1734]|uniref:MaoC family dehydratase N-terminal domain-containing protein n=1 Tax=Skermania sp. ID1734 TaxID=2597516 RepID=UPI00117C3E4D|nr:MaoC family dehydratase N-terminal domain-containing protein [Skermania sp. ID1734]TSE01590.1 MaoC family dehydratase [Skermania sp. ID1734]
MSDTVGTIDREAALALDFAPVRTIVERGRLTFFARATGQTDPIWTDVEAARAAGYRDLPVPPTFFFSLELERPAPFGYLDQLGVDIGRILHGGQRFRHHATVYAGDELVLQTRIVDVSVRKGGALEILVKGTDVLRGDELVAEATATIVVRNPGASS